MAYGMNNMTQQLLNSVLIQGASLEDIKNIIEKAVDERMTAFYESIRERPPVFVRRKEAAKMIGVSLPTLDQYIKFGFVKAQHLGGRVYVDEQSIISYQQKNSK